MWDSSFQLSFPTVIYNGPFIRECRVGGETDEVLRVAVGGGPMENRILISLTGERKKERRLEWSKVGRGCSHLTTSAFCPTTQVTPYTVGRDVILTTRRGFSFYSEILHRRRYPGSRV